MSLLHRNLIAAAFKDMLAKIEPIAAETAEAVISVVAPASAPIANAAIETAEAIFGAPGQTTSSHVDAAVAAASGQTTAAPSAAPAPAPSAPAAPAPAPVVNVAADKSSAALAAVDALALQLSNLATQLAAIRTNLT